MKVKFIVTILSRRPDTRIYITISFACNIVIKLISWKTYIAINSPIDILLYYFEGVVGDRSTHSMIHICTLYCFKLISLRIRGIG